MIEPAIVIKDLSKVYRLYNSPFDRLKELIFRRPYHSEFVSLNNINITVYKGETIGIIGENGAGKSTLLKIIAGTLRPSSGVIKLSGTVSALLELGSGLHPEFSGIENIYFYGSLLGMDKAHIKTKVSEIIEFAEIGEFIQYPIKTYSSGMFVRLAFSVATAINPDILVIDEALSVGDQYFQKKCLEKMADFRKQKKTIVFCSHDMYQIRTFCDRAVWLHNGRIVKTDKAEDVANEYINDQIARSERYKDQDSIASSTTKKDTDSTKLLFIRGLKIAQNDKNGLTINFYIETTREFLGHLGWAILRQDYLQVSFYTTKMQGLDPILLDSTKKVSIKIRGLNIVNGIYLIYVGVFDSEAYKPIAVESLPVEIKTDIEIHNSLCYFDSEFIIN